MLPLLAGAAGAAAAISMSIASDLSDIDSRPLYGSEKSPEQKSGCPQQTWPYVDANCVDGSVTQLRRIRVIPIGENTPSHVLAAVLTSAPARSERAAKSPPSERLHEADAARLHTGPPNSQVSPEGSHRRDDAAVVRVVGDGKARAYRVPRSHPLGSHPPSALLYARGG
jgi:hypothetical protein